MHHRAMEHHLPYGITLLAATRCRWTHPATQVGTQLCGF